MIALKSQSLLKVKTEKFMNTPTNLFALIRNLSLSLLILALPQIVRADPVEATVSSIKGTVVVTDAAGKVVSVAEGTKLATGDTVKTGADGTLGLTLTPGAGTVVMPNTEVKIATLDFTKGADGSNNRTVLLNLKNGDLISTLFKKDGHSDFKVATPYGVAAAKGTTWGVAIQGGAVVVSVVNGVVVVTNAAGGSSSVSAGTSYNSGTGATTTLSAAQLGAIQATLQESLPASVLSGTASAAAAAAAIANALSVNPSSVVSQQQITNSGTTTNSPP